MIFLQDIDIMQFLSDEDQTALQTRQPEFINPAEQLALAEVKRALADFDTAQALAPWVVYLETETYASGTRVVFEDTTFYALQAVPAGITPADPAFWATGDTRLPELVNVLARLTIYNLAGRLSLGNLPATLAARAAEARQWLQDQASGAAPALLAKLPSDAAPRYGSIPPKTDGGTIWG
jgi:hypothetical protein